MRMAIIITVAEREREREIRNAINHRLENLFFRIVSFFDSTVIHRGKKIGNEISRVVLPYNTQYRASIFQCEVK